MIGCLTYQKGPGFTRSRGLLFALHLIQAGAVVRKRPRSTVASTYCEWVYCCHWDEAWGHIFYVKLLGMPLSQSNCTKQYNDDVTCAIFWLSSLWLVGCWLLRAVSAGSHVSLRFSLNMSVTSIFVPHQLPKSSNNKCRDSKVLFKIPIRQK